jgi:UDP-N-acetyl-D-mannosaminuronic acid transferase (WecB/TagA/CpsF family)
LPPDAVPSVHKAAGRLDVPVIITGGSYLDHLAERVYWYTPWALKLPLAWAYRLTREPGRLWKRYSLEYLAYGRMVARAKFGKPSQTASQ